MGPIMTAAPDKRTRRGPLHVALRTEISVGVNPDSNRLTRPTVDLVDHRALRDAFWCPAARRRQG